MQAKTVVVSLPVSDLARSLSFYREGLGLAPSDVDEVIIAFELPNLSLFLIVTDEYATYIEKAGVAASAVPRSGCVHHLLRHRHRRRGRRGPCTRSSSGSHHVAIARGRRRLHWLLQ